MKDENDKKKCENLLSDLGCVFLILLFTFIIFSLFLFFRA